MLQTTIDDLIQDETTGAIVVDVSAGDDIDITTADAISIIFERDDEADVDVVRARVHETLKRDFERNGVNLTNRVYQRVEGAVAAYRDGQLKAPEDTQTPSTEET